MTERCVRCAEPGGIVMSFDYLDATAWLDDLTAPVDPGSAYPMCDDHAEAFTPPVGWTLVDRREPRLRPLSLEVA
jgi:hypothetical protein